MNSCDYDRVWGFVVALVDAGDASVGEDASVTTSSAVTSRSSSFRSDASSCSPCSATMPSLVSLRKSSTAIVPSDLIKPLRMFTSSISSFSSMVSAPKPAVKH